MSLKIDQKSRHSTSSTLDSVHVASLTAETRRDAGLRRRFRRVSFNWGGAVLGALALLFPRTEAPLDGVFEVVSEVVVRGRRGRFGEGASTVLF